ncbi:MAG: glycosyltransferase [Candidatus Aureabacteria bacterium]|nr:glycosyltransferase [Candidatus Auribacterota bacterium]
MNNKIICHIISSMDLGGNERMLSAIIAGLDSNIYHNHIIFLDRGSDKSKFLKDYAEQSGVKTLVISSKGYFDWSVVKKLGSALKSVNPDIVHTHLYLAQIYGRIAARNAAVPVIISSEQNVYFYKKHFPFRLLEKYLSGFTTRIIASSNGVRQYLIDKVGIQKDKINVIYNCINVADFRAAPNPAASDTVSIGALGHLHRQKGYEYLLDAAKMVSSSDPGARFSIGGSGPLKGRLQRRIAALGLEDKVRLAGFVDDAKAYLKTIDIFVMPSLWEGFGISALEAMASGRPVIVSDVAGLNELVEDGKSGLLVKPGDASGLAQKISMLCRDRDLRVELGKNAAERAGRFSCGEIIPLFGKLYDELT